MKDPKNALEYFNDPKKVNISLDNLVPSKYQEEVSFDADITIVIRRDLGDQGGLSIFNGIRGHRTAVILEQNFIFDRQLIIKEIGNMLGCSKQAGASMKDFKF